MNPSGLEETRQLLLSSEHQSSVLQRSLQHHHKKQVRVKKHTWSTLSCCPHEYVLVFSYAAVLSRFEQAFISRLLRKQISVEPQYFWIGLQDIKNKGEYQWLSQDGTPGVVPYTNWGWLEPG